MKNLKDCFDYYRRLREDTPSKPLFDRYRISEIEENPDDLFTALYYPITYIRNILRTEGWYNVNESYRRDTQMTFVTGKRKDIFYPKIVSKINKKVNLLGYQVTRKYDNKYCNLFEITISQKLRGYTYTPKDSQSGRKYYHITYRNLLEDIAKKGIHSSRANSIFTHPNSTYLIHTDELKIMGIKHTLVNPEEIKNVVVLEINQPFLDVKHDKLLRSDHTYNICYTDDVIHPPYIERTSL